jgi:6-pyruvoyltetrahydropterin/6-carboxytetrahydropterin synthase
MFKVSKEIMISATHRVREHQGGCERIHGHNWKIIVTAGAEELNEMGMVIDFKDLKNAMHKIIMPMDHNDINTYPPFDIVNPTSENLAKYIFDEMSKELNNNRMKIVKVKVYETDSSAATYSI